MLLILNDLVLSRFDANSCVCYTNTNSGGTEQLPQASGGSTLSAEINITAIVQNGSHGSCTYFTILLFWKICPSNFIRCGFQRNLISKQVWSSCTEWISRYMHIFSSPYYLKKQSFKFKSLWLPTKS